MSSPSYLVKVVIPIATGVVIVPCLDGQRVRVLAIDVQSALPAGEAMKFIFSQGGQALIHVTTAGGDGNQADWCAFIGAESTAIASATIDALCCALPGIWWDTDVQVSIVGSDASPVTGSARLVYEVLTAPRNRLGSSRPTPRKRRT